jgi:hypothetical protein
MGRNGFRIIGILFCILGAWLVYFFALGNLDGKLIEVPGYVKAFFMLVGFGVFGLGTSFWKMSSKR